MATAIKKYSKHFNATNLINMVFAAIPHAYTTSVTAYKKHHTQGAATAAYVLRYVIFPKNSTIYHEHTKYIRLRTLVIPRGLMKRGELLWYSSALVELRITDLEVVLFLLKTS